VDTVRILRYVSIAEATSFLILLLCSVLKRTVEFEAGVQVMGPIHGVLFLAFVALVFMVRGPLGWDVKRTVLALIASVLPFAPYFVERSWLREPVAAAR
jgi:integral membrane protein